MRAGASLAAAAVLSLAALVVRADHRADGGLISSFFPQAQAYESVDYRPPTLPPLTPPRPVEIQTAPPVVAAVEAIPAPAPAYQEASAFPAVPELEPADDLVAMNTTPSAPQKPYYEPPELTALNVLDSDVKTPAQRAAPQLHIASFDGAPCGDACSRAAVAPVQTAERFERVIPNPDLHWRQLPCSQPGAYRYELVNDGDQAYNRLVVYNGGERWNIGTLDSHQTAVLSSPEPFGRRTLVDHDPHFASSWSQRR